LGRRLANVQSVPSGDINGYGSVNTVINLLIKDTRKFILTSSTANVEGSGVPEGITGE
jgi:hypothetical protein